MAILYNNQEFISRKGKVYKCPIGIQIKDTCVLVTKTPDGVQRLYSFSKYGDRAFFIACGLLRGWIEERLVHPGYFRGKSYPRLRSSVRDGFEYNYISYSIYESGKGFRTINKYVNKRMIEEGVVEHLNRSMKIWQESIELYTREILDTFPMSKETSNGKQNERSTG